MTDDQEVSEEETPATRLLDALGRGDLGAVLLEFRPTTIVRTEDHSWSIQGEDSVVSGLEQALDRFPGLVFDSHSRHIGFGRVIEEARVRDLAVTGGDPTGEAAETAAEADTTAHAGGTTGGGSRAMVLDRDFGKSDTPRLNMPVRVTVMHDDQNVHEVILSFPKALFRAALGIRVDPLDLAVSEIQSAFVAPVGSGFRTYQLGSRPPPPTDLTVPEPGPLPVMRAVEPERVPTATLASVFADNAPPAPPEVEPAIEPEHEPDPEPVLEDDGGQPPPYTSLDDDDEPRRRAWVLVPVVVVLIALIAGGAWYLTQGNGGATPAAGHHHKPKPGHSPSGKGSGQPTPKASSASGSPTQPSHTKTPKPNLVLSSDLAFAKGSAVLSDPAKQKIAQIADEVRKNKLHGTIAVHGYTDNLGSAASGLELSRQRADTVAAYLHSHLGSYNITISAIGYGEADPVASNATEAGRSKNRRVTITLPKN